MECTGVYHLSVFHALMEHFPQFKSNIYAMNPLLVHNRICDLGNKNDKADARSLSKLALYREIIRPSYIGTKEFFALRDIMRCYHRNQSQISMFRNRIHRHLCSVNQKFKFDLSTEWGLKFLDFYCSKSWSLFEAYNNLHDTLSKLNKTKVLIRQKQEIERNG